MKRVQGILVFCIILISAQSIGAANCNSVACAALEKDQAWNFWGKFKPEMFYGKNISLINDVNDWDRVWYWRDTLDIYANGIWGQKACCYPVLEFMLNVRNKIVWGSPKTVGQTTDTPIKILDNVLGNHRHYLTKMYPWFREVWLKVCLNDAMELSFADRKQFFTLGAFSFELGRGIALGDAYAVGPELLGFYSDAAIDQYAFGFKLSGDMTDHVKYNLYGAILDNKSASLGDTGDEIFGQLYGRLNTPRRGFGHVNYVVASDVYWTAFNNQQGKFTVEPYIVYNNDPEQRIEIRGDADSKLGTAGVAGEFTSDNFEFGFDTAFNFGRQFVKGLDRNDVQALEVDGFYRQVNSHVYVGVDPNNPPAGTNLSLYKVTETSSTSQGRAGTALVDTSVQSSCQNGQLIGNIPGYMAAVGNYPAPAAGQQDNFWNAPDNIGFGRYRDPFVNRYAGWMGVADAAYIFCDRAIQISATAGIATGDEDPSDIEFNTSYKAFVPLQEAYTGKRVKSAFLMGGAGKLKRPLSVPTPTQNSNRFAETVDGFTNIAFIGLGSKWEPKAKKRFSVRPNMIFYWQQFSTKKFDLTTLMTTNIPARDYLGFEINTFADYNVLKDLKAYIVASVFVPGSHYRDIRGLPMSAAEARSLSRLNDTGVNAPRPGLGTDVAWTINFGLEYKF